MSSCNDTVLRQRRRELDARRSKSRVRLGSCLQSWAQLKDKLGFTLHSELAQHLLESYVSRACIKCSGDGKEGGTISTTKESLQELILMVHEHGQTCPLPPVLHCRPVPKTSERGQSGRREGETEPKKLAGANECFKYTCEDGHQFLWYPITMEKLPISKSDSDKITSSSKRLKQGKRQMKEPIADTERQEMMTRLKTRQQQRENADTDTNNVLGQKKNADVTATPEAQDRNDMASGFSYSEHGSPADSDEMTADAPVMVHIEDQSHTVSYEEDAVLNLTNRGTQSSADHTEKRSASKKTGILQSNSLQSLKKDVSQIGGKRKRKSTSKLILLCEFEGCDKIFSSRQYLNHHIKYQHLHQKTFTCSHPSCRKSFNFKKHLKEHEKLHSNQRDYICEFCARAFRTSSNLIIHRRIHTGEKPLQCEVCGFTCRQKASLNWHMRKHNAESTYQFPCEICGRRFEKRDNVTAHRSKSHPDYNTGTPERSLPLPPPDSLPHPSRHSGSSPSVSKNQTTAE